MTTGSKIRRLQDAVSEHVKPGMHLNFASTPSRSNAGVREVARQFRARDPGFVISMTGFHSLAHLLAILRLGRKYIACFFGDNFPVPRPNPLYASLLRDGATLEMWSLLSYVSSLRAGALGQPHAVTRSLIGTDLARDLGSAGIYREVADPTAPREARIAFVSAMRPDVTFVHAIMGDADGNVVSSAPYSEGFWGALGARKGVIATVERVVSPDECARHADAIKIPSHRVLAVCEEPFGAHPQPMYASPHFDRAGYMDDFAHYEKWRDLCAGGWRLSELSKAVLEPDDGTAAYHAWVGKDRLTELALAAHDLRASIEGARRDPEGRTTLPPRRRPRRPPSGRIPPPLGAQTGREPNATDAPSRANEILLVLAARKIVERVRAGGYRVLLAGIGHAFIAARMAKAWLAHEGIAVRVMVETGLFDVECGPAADEFLLSYRNIALARRLSSVEDVLGSITCGADNGCLGVLGAAQVDLTGAVNSTRVGDKLLVGSGGANDIASCAAEVVVLTRCTPTRLVSKVDYVTSPGHAVLNVVTDLCTFSRATSDAARPWIAGDVYPAYGGRPPSHALGVIRENCMWSFVTPADAEYAPIISTTEMALVHALDPGGIHWRRERSRVV